MAARSVYCACDARHLRLKDFIDSELRAKLTAHAKVNQNTPRVLARRGAFMSKPDDREQRIRERAFHLWIEDRQPS